MKAISLLAAALGAAALPAFADAGAASGDEEVVVTGSRIKGTPENAALPVDVITAGELARRGSPSTLDLIKSLPVAGPVVGDTNQFSSFIFGQAGAGSINLRGLGHQRTLILMNGRRLPASPSFNSSGVDTQLLPSAALGRVEILKDGAAAVYGSDAVAGVVNFITRRDLDGFLASADYRAIEGNGGDYSASLAWGWSDGGTDILLSLGYQHRDALSTLDRDWAYPPYLENPSGWSVYGTPGSFLPRNAANVPTAGVIRDANCAALGGAAEWSNMLPVCRFSYVPFDNLIEEENRAQAYGEINVDLSPGTRFHGEALYAATDVPEWRSSPGYAPFSGLNGPSTSGTFTVPVANPGALTALQQAGLSPSVIAATDNISLTLFRPLGWGGNPNTGGLGGLTDHFQRDLWRLSGGLSGELGSVGWDLNLTYSRTSVSAEAPDMLIERLQKALNGFGGPNCTGNVAGANGCLWFNPFSNAIAFNAALGNANPGYVAANANDPELIAWMEDRQRQRQTQTLFAADAALNGTFDFLELPGGRIGWALGAQYRENAYEREIFSPYYNANITPCPVVGQTNCAVQTGPYIFLGQAVPGRYEQSVWAVFGELNLPVTDTLSAQLALRHESYDGLTGASTDPKLALKWQVTDWLALRGSVGTTFRGPTALNIASGTVTALQALPATGGGFRAWDLAANPQIGPEKADTFNVGAILEFEGLRVLADYWSIRLKDQIIAPNAIQVTNTLFPGAPSAGAFVNCAAPLRGLVTFDNANVCTQGVTTGANISRVRTDYTNGPDVDTSGIDLTVDLTRDDVYGFTVNAGASVSYVLTYDQAEFVYDGVVLEPAFEAVGFTNYNRAVQTIPRWRGNFYLELQKDIHNVRLQVNHVAGVTDNRAPVYVQTGPLTSCTAPGPDCVLVTFGRRVKSNTTVDLTYRVELPSDVTLSASVLNMFDVPPSAARLELSYDPFLGSVVGRSFKIGVTKAF